MVNAWLDEIRIRNAVALLEKLTNDEFRGLPPNTSDWKKFIQETVDVLYPNDIVIFKGLCRYDFLCELDSLGMVSKMKLVEVRY